MRFLKSEKPHTMRKFLLPVIAFIIVFAVFYYAVDSMSESTVERQKEALQTAVRQSVVYCYSVEGSYPQDVEYLEQHYGLTYDHDRFYVGYRLQGTNIMPDITIIDLKASGYTDDTQQVGVSGGGNAAVIGGES